jgi:hypothetical protein
MKFNKILIFYTVLYVNNIIISQCEAQNATRLSGKIIENDNLQPLPYVSILVNNSNIGTITNNEGYFNLLIPNKYNEDTVFISHLGYDPVIIKLKRFACLDTVVKLNKTIYNINEVEVSYTSPENILRSVIKNLPKNYGPDPVILTGFLRTRKIVNDSLALFSEAIIDDLKSGYYLYKKWNLTKKLNSTDIPHLIKGRYFVDSALINSLPEQDQYAYQIGLYFSDIMECYRGYFLDPTEFKNYKYAVKYQTDQNKRTIIRISFNQIAGVKGLLHEGEINIDPVDYAVLKIYLAYSHNGHKWFNDHFGKQAFTLRNIPGWKLSPPELDATFTYANKNGLWYLQSKTIDWEFTYKHSDYLENIVYKMQIQLAIINSSRNEDIISSFKGDKYLGLKQNWDQIIGPIDGSFWNSWNHIPLESKINEQLKNK